MLGNVLQIRKHIMPSTLRRIDQTFHKPLQLMFECSNCESRIMYVDDEDDDFKYNELSDNDSQEVTPRSDISSDEMGYACTRNGYLWCKNCNYFALNCSICLENVQGMFSVCRLCGHGGHFNHMQHWFEKYEKCPTGCGCDCGNQRELRDASDIDSTASNAMLSDLGEYPRGHSRTNTADGAGLYYEKMRYNFSDYTYNNFTDLALDEHTFADNFDDNY